MIPICRLFGTYHLPKTALPTSVKCLVFSFARLGDGAGAEVTAFGDDALVVGTGADGEAPDVDAVTVPVGGDEGLDGFVGTGDHVAHDSGTGYGAVDDDENVAFGHFLGASLGFETKLNGLIKIRREGGAAKN